MRREASRRRKCGAGWSHLAPLCCWANVLVLLVVSAGAAAAKSHSVGILPIQSSEKLRAELTVSLPVALHERTGLRVEGPNQLVARLAAIPGTLAAKRAAQASITRAESYELGMQRGLALDAARQAVEGLRQVGARFHDSALWTKAQLTLARVLLLKPPDPQAARLALHEAVQASPGITSGEYAPRLARLLTQVTQHGSTPLPPSREELRVLVQRAGVGSIVWLGARPADGVTKVCLVSYRRVDQSYSLVERRLTGRELAGQIAAMAAWSLGPAALGQQSRPEQGRRPWYRRWWIWVAAGTVLAAATAGTIYATLPGDEFAFRVKTSGK